MRKSQLNIYLNDSVSSLIHAGSKVRHDQPSAKKTRLKNHPRPEKNQRTEQSLKVFQAFFIFSKGTTEKSTLRTPAKGTRGSEEGPSNLRHSVILCQSAMNDRCATIKYSSTEAAQSARRQTAQTLSGSILKGNQC